MTRKYGVAAVYGLAVCSLLVLVVGCGPNEKDLKIKDLTAENDQLKGELADRDQQLNDAMVRENDARRTIDELNQELAKMRAEGSKSKEGEWVTFKDFDMIAVPGEVLFDAGKADLTPKGRQALAQLASDIREKYADRDIYVFGHTDAQPIRKSKWKDNWELGASRALTVIRALHAQGLSYGQLIQANCGEYRPTLSSGKTDVPQNRRVEFYAVRRNTGLIDATAARGAD